jgi:hypothetical protein
MAATLFTQNIIACIWDFDKTLIPDYMQSPLFRRYGVDEATFWAETTRWSRTTGGAATPFPARSATSTTS